MAPHSFNWAYRAVGFTQRRGKTFPDVDNCTSQGVDNQDLLSKVNPEFPEQSEQTEEVRDRQQASVKGF